MKKLLLQIHNKIQSSSKFPDNQNILFGNFGGYVLFYLYLYRYTEDEYYYNLAIEKIKSSRNNQFLNYSYCSGVSGQLYLIEFLKKNEFLNISNEFGISKIDTQIYEWTKLNITNRKLDFLHESVGTLYYLIYKYENGSKYLKKHIQELINSLFDQLTVKNEFVYWMAKHQNELNLGISHGSLSIFYVLSYAYSLSLIPSEQYETLKTAINSVIKKYPVLENEIIYPLTYDFETDKEERFVTLAWCYGDLGNSVALAKIATFINDKNLYEYARKLGLNTLKAYNGYKPKDAAICHGISGIYLLYRRLYEFYEDKDFLLASESWYKELINKDFAFLSSAYLTNEKKYIENLSFLEGLTGVGLCILSKTELHNKNWTELLLI